MSKVTAYNNKPYPLVYIFTNENGSKTFKVNKNLHFFLIVLVILCVSISGIAFYFYSKATELNGRLTNIDISNYENIKTNLAKIIILPEEIPQIEIVLAPENYKEFEFFPQLKQGDLILVYSKNSKAIAYRQSQNILIGVTSKLPNSSIAGVQTNFSIESNSAESSETSNVRSVYKIRIINGTTTTGVATEFQKKLQMENRGEFQITSVSQANRDTYKGMKIVVVNEEAESFADNLAKKYKMQKIKAPSDENIDNEDILIIIGSE